MRMRTMAWAVAMALGQGHVLGAMAATLTKEEHGKLDKMLQAHYKASGDGFVLEVEGADDVSGLKSALEKTRVEAKALKDAKRDLEEKLKAFDGLNAAEIKELLSRIEGDEDLKLIKAGKIEELLAKKTEKMLKDHQKELAAAAKKYDEQVTANKGLRQTVVDNALRAAAAKAGVHAAGTEDALLRGRQVFSTDETGTKVVQLDSEGKVVTGKNGKDPFGPEEWFGSMKESAPHWFSHTNGGGGGRGDGGAGGKKTYTRKEFNGMDPAAQAAVSADVRAGKAALVDSPT